MKLRVFATLLMAFTSLISSVSQAQFGYGYYMGAQPCVGYGNASGSSDEDDEEAELRADRKELRKEKKDLEKDYRRLERDLEEARDAISDVIKPNWATVIFEHMDKGLNCQVCAPPRVAEVPSTFRPPPPPVSPAPAEYRRDTSTRITIVEENQPEPIRPRPSEDDAKVQTFPVPQPYTTPIIEEPREPQTPRKKKAPKPIVKPKDLSQNASNNSRMPASETVSAGAQVIKTTPIEEAQPAGDDWGSDIGGSYGNNGSPTLCRPNEKPFTMNAWKRICNDGGRIDRAACTTRYYQRGETKTPQANSCGRSLDRYRKIVVEMEKTQNRLARLDDEIDRIGYQLKDLKYASRDRDMEADCPSGRCHERGSTRERKSRGPSLGQTLLAVGLDALRIGGGIYLGHEANKFNRETGNQATPYVAQGLLSGGFYPYATAGLYGGLYGGSNGAFGCSPTIGANGVMGPMGAFGPMGVMGAYGPGGGAFGYPQAMMPMYPIMGGGAYLPGAGPWGANGPWGVGQWPGGYPQVGGALAGQLAFFPGGGAYPYGSPYGGYGAPYGGVPYGGAPYGMPYGSQFPYGGAGIAGQIAGLPYGAPYGMPYGSQFPYGGVGAGLPYGSPFPYGSQMPYGSSFPYGSQMPYGSPFPYGAQGPYGFPGAGGGFGQQDSILLQRQIEAQRSRLNLYQSFIQEYSQFQSKWNMYFGSGSGTSTFTNDYIYTQPGSTGPTTNTGTGRTR